jgi:hypothetical protein
LHILLTLAHKVDTHLRGSASGIKETKEEKRDFFRRDSPARAREKQNVRQLFDAMKSGELHSPELADKIEEASREFRKNFSLRDGQF